MFESWFSPNPAAPATLERSPEAQQRVDGQTSELALYHYESCMFCARVRQAIARLHLKIELRDIMCDGSHRQALEQGGGRTTVPCLRIGSGPDARWMYESADIIAYLAGRFSDSSKPGDPGGVATV
jgi:glutathione S-transferase